MNFDSYKRLIVLIGFFARSATTCTAQMKNLASLIFIRGLRRYLIFISFLRGNPEPVEWLCFRLSRLFRG
jgi:hypothetical protein